MVYLLNYSLQMRKKAVITENLTIKAPEPIMHLAISDWQVSRYCGNGSVCAIAMRPNQSDGLAYAAA